MIWRSKRIRVPTRTLIAASAVVLSFWVGFLAATVTGLGRLRTALISSSASIASSACGSTIGSTVSSAVAPPASPASGQADTALSMASDLPGADVGSSAEEAAAAREPEIMAMPVSGVVTGEYGWYRDPVFSDWRFRDGIDISCPAGAEVDAALSGLVRSILSEDSGSGNLRVVLEHPGGVFTTYGNLGRVLVAEGAKVALGTAIGTASGPGGPYGGAVRFGVEAAGDLRDPSSCIEQPF